MKPLSYWKSAVTTLRAGMATAHNKEYRLELARAIKFAYRMIVRIERRVLK